jgi:acyl transferase domain-containing protein
LEGRADDRSVLSGTVSVGRGARKVQPEGTGAGASLETALAGRELLELARLWITGVEIPWERLHPAGTRRRLALPTYPFARERYWVQPATAPAHPAPQAPDRSRTEPQPPLPKEELREVLRQLKRRERSVDEVAQLLRR